MTRPGYVERSIAELALEAEQAAERERRLRERIAELERQPPTLDRAFANDCDAWRARAASAEELVFELQERIIRIRTGVIDALRGDP